MGKIKTTLRNLSFKASFVLYVAVCMLAATAISAAIIQATDSLKQEIYAAYQQPGDTYYLTTKKGERLGDGVLVLSAPPLMSAADNRKVDVLDGVSRAAIPVVFSICVVVSAFLFYTGKLKQPLKLLTDASAQISQHNLDFSLAYNRNDEMGKLCQSFETMRRALQINNLAMWRQIEERKRLNAAFSHDLRTPLTVLKGQSDMLLKYVPDGVMTEEKIVSTVATMKSHIVRLENYVEIMNRLQKLEDIDIRKTDVPAAEIAERLKSSGAILCEGKELQVDERLAAADSVHVDLSFVMQVYENLLANAARFAKHRIRVALTGEGAFALTVSDDGPGFGDKELLEATKPFYKSGDHASELHFGMGLHICSILCEKHGGFLKLSNDGGGATVKAVF